MGLLEESRLLETDLRRAPAFAELPFVECAPGQQPQLWVVRPAGLWSEDCATGRRYADDLLTFMRAKSSTPQLTYIIRAMPPGDQWTGIEVGFIEAIGKAAIS